MLVHQTVACFPQCIGVLHLLAQRAERDKIGSRPFNLDIYIFVQLKFRAFEHGGKKLKNTRSIFSSTMCPFYQNMLVVRCCEVLTSHCQAWGMRPKMADEVMPKAGWYCFEPGRQNAANSWSIFQNGAIMICTCVVNSDAATVGTMEIKDHKQNYWSIYSIISIILFKSMQYEAMCNDMQPLSIMLSDQ